MKSWLWINWQAEKKIVYPYYGILNSGAARRISGEVYKGDVTTSLNFSINQFTKKSGAVIFNLEFFLMISMHYKIDLKHKKTWEIEITKFTVVVLGRKIFHFLFWIFYILLVYSWLDENWTLSSLFSLVRNPNEGLSLAY